MLRGYIIGRAEHVRSMIWAEKGQTNPDIELSSAKFTCGGRVRVEHGWKQNHASTRHTLNASNSRSLRRAEHASWSMHCSPHIHAPPMLRAPDNIPPFSDHAQKNSIFRTGCHHKLSVIRSLGGPYQLVLPRRERPRLAFEICTANLGRSSRNAGSN